MAKLKSAPITQQDLEEFLASESDFAFEMKVLDALRKLGFACEHSGLYEDPVTNKFREFDIRAIKNHGSYKLSLAVECKNFQASYPLLVLATRRTPDETFHQMISYYVGSMNYPRIERVKSDQSLYSLTAHVGKSTNQVGRPDTKEKQPRPAFVVNDDAAYDKISQAINSSRDLVVDAMRDGSPPLIRVILPVLVVPSAVLWQIDYNSDGSVAEQVRQVQETTYFINHLWSEQQTRYVNFRISHLHIVTFDRLKDAIAEWLGENGFFRA